MKNTVRTLLVRFNTLIKREEVTMFRGAILRMMEQHPNTLFHNHEEEGFRYSYPLIQYKRIQQKAAILCINDGADAVGMLLSHLNEDIQLGERNVKLDLLSVKANQYTFQLWDYPFAYTIRKWLPLNQVNYEAFQALESLAERSLFLEKILTANILSMAKGVGVFFEDRVNCKIIDFTEPAWVNYKGVKVISLDATFKTNVSIPDYIGLGKGSSINHGTTTRVKNNNRKNNE